MQFEHVTIVVLTTCTLLATCIALPTRTRYCGSNLADAIMLACGPNGYNVPSWATVDHQEATKQKTTYIRSLGVATECCYLGCSWKTLASYCADPKTKKTKKSSGDEEQYDSEKELSISMPTEERSVKETDVLAVAPEVGGKHKKPYKPASMGKRGGKGKNKRKNQNGRKGRKRGQRSRGGRLPRCRCVARKKRPKKVELDNIKRIAPVFGTVSPEYLRLPRTLDELPQLYQAMQGY